MALQFIEDGALSPSAIFMMAMTTSVVTAGVAHPQELKCIVPGLLYIILIPCMYLLLIIFSAIRCNDISWGTREVAAKKTKKVKKKKLKH